MYHNLVIYYGTVKDVSHSQLRSNSRPCVSTMWGQGLKAEKLRSSKRGDRGHAVYKLGLIIIS